MTVNHLQQMRVLDPDTALAAMRQALIALGKHRAGDDSYVDDLLTIAEHAEALDEWCSCGGRPPTAWVTATGRRVDVGADQP